jgi:integrase/recombinase XerD
MMIPEYINYLERNQARPKTIKSYSSKARIFVAWLDKQLVGIPEVDPNKIYEFHQHLMIDRKQKASTRVAYLGALRNYFDFLVSQGLFRENPAKAVAKPKIHKTPPNSLDEEEIEKMMIAAFDKKTEKGMRDLAMIAVLTGTACRVSAMTGMKLTDFRPTEVLIPENCQHCGQPILTGRLAGRGKKKKVTMVRIREKAGKEWDIIMPDKAAMYLGQYLNSRKTGANTDIVFPVKERGTGEIKPISRHGVLYAIQRLADKAGIVRKISPHCFRHAAITWLLDLGTDPEVVQRMVGHRALYQTMEYRNKSIRAFVWSGVGADKNLFENVKTPLDTLFDKLHKK